MCQYKLSRQQLIDRFKRYIAIDTKSDPTSSTVPSTAIQFDLAKVLYQELQEMGMSDVYLDEKNCYVYAKLPANTTTSAPKIGFLAHIDTAPDMNGKCINPQLVKYEGGDIKLNDQFSISLETFPFIADFVGEELITTDGTTLLGADDKAGMAEIMEALVYLQAHPEIKHGQISVAFVPDEEIGHGASLLDLERFDADFAYTLDGDREGGIEYETFNAAHAEIKIQGRNVHPGSAKNKMINASLVAMELNQLLPVQMRPELTENYEGFYLLTQMSGTVEEAELQYIIRDHNKAEFERKKQYLAECVQMINNKYQSELCTISLADSYYNMGEIIEQNPQIVKLANRAMTKIGVTPFSKPVRGGTDGAQLSFRGLPCPNLFTGGFNYHGRYEFAVVSQMLNACKTVISIAETATSAE